MKRGLERQTTLITMALLAATSFSTGVLAQDAGGSRIEDKPALAQVPQPIAFNIPAQPLASALTAFGRQSGYQVSVDQATLASLTSTSVSGAMSPDEALHRLLSGTGLVWRAGGGRSVFITKAAGDSSGALQLDPVQVQGSSVPAQAMIDNIPPPYAGGQVATGGQMGFLGNRGVMDTPFNETSYTAKKAQDQQATTVRDVLADNPSVRFFNADSSGSGDNMRIRGFSVSSQETAYGGLYGILATGSIMAELAERIEILNGPSAMLSGIAPFGGNIGGTVNIVPKRAGEAPLTQITATAISAANAGAHVDVGRRLGEDKQFGVRFNGVYRAGPTAVEGTSDERALATLGLDYRGKGVRLSADLGYQYRYLAGATPYVGVGNQPVLPAPSARRNFGEPWNDQEYKDLFGVVRGEVDLVEKVTAYASFGAHDFRFGGISGGNPIVNNANGNATSTPYNNFAYYTYLSGDAGVRGEATTGPIGHQFAAGISMLYRENGQRVTQGTAFATNIYNPTIIARPTIAQLPVNKTNATTMTSFALADTLSGADKRIQLTLGGRLQRIAQQNFNVITGALTTSYDQQAFSPSVALVVRPFWENVSFYANWIQGLQPGAIVSTPFANAGEAFPPYKATQYEAGVKIDWGRLTTTMSVFQISQPSVITNTTNNTQVLGGEQQNQGFEFNVFGEVTEGVRVLGGVMLLNAVLTKTPNGLTNGWIAPMAPGAQFNVALEWDLPFAPGLTVDGRVTYTGAQYFDTTWPRRMLPEWTRLDIGARYAFDNPGAQGKQLIARLNVENLLDTNYWASANGAFLSLGNPRTFRLSLTADF